MEIRQLRDLTSSTTAPHTVGLEPHAVCAIAIVRLTLVDAPIPASWLNQIEIYFSIVQRKVLTPNDFTDLNALAERLLDFQYYWETTARPFEWKFTRRDLGRFLSRLGPQN